MEAGIQRHRGFNASSSPCSETVSESALQLCCTVQLSVNLNKLRFILHCEGSAELEGSKKRWSSKWSVRTRKMEFENEYIQRLSREQKPSGKQPFFRSEEISIHLAGGLRVELASVASGVPIPSFSGSMVNFGLHCEGEIQMAPQVCMYDSSSLIGLNYVLRRTLCSKGDPSQDELSKLSQCIEQSTFTKKQLVEKQEEEL